MTLSSLPCVPAKDGLLYCIWPDVSEDPATTRPTLIPQIQSPGVQCNNILFSFLFPQEHGVWRRSVRSSCQGWPAVLYLPRCARGPRPSYFLRGMRTARHVSTPGWSTNTRAQSVEHHCTAHTSGHSSGRITHNIPGKQMEPVGSGPCFGDVPLSIDKAVQDLRNVGPVPII